MIGVCPQCNRRFRSKEAYALYLKRLAVIESLRMNVEAEHLKPYTVEPIGDKRERHMADSEAHRSGHA